MIGGKCGTFENLKETGVSELQRGEVNGQEENEQVGRGGAVRSGKEFGVYSKADSPGKVVCGNKVRFMSFKCTNLLYLLPQLRCESTLGTTQEADTTTFTFSALGMRRLPGPRIHTGSKVGSKSPTLSSTAFQLPWDSRYLSPGLKVAARRVSAHHEDKRSYQRCRSLICAEPPAPQQAIHL